MNAETLSAPSCRRCGSERWRTERLALTTVAARWLMGNRWLRPDLQVCAECGAQGASSFTYGPDHPGSMMTVSKAALSLVRGPAAPVVYLAAGSIALAVGLAADMRYGVAWWHTAAAMLAAAWVGVQLAGVVTGISRERFLALRNVLDPSIAATTDREHRELLRKYRTAPFPIFELDQQWEGPRKLGPYSFDRQRLHSIALEYHDIPPPTEPSTSQAGPSVTVTTRPRHSGDHVPERSGADIGPALLRRELLRRGFPADVGSHAGEQAALRIDGREAQGWTAKVDDGRLAVLDLGEVVVQVRTTDADPRDVALRRTGDLDPYLQGQRE